MLEHWDPDRGRWTMYRDRYQHAADCARYPFDLVPRRIFLDTNIVNLMVKHRARIFEQAAVAAELERSAALDAEALMHVFSVGSRAGWELVASSKTMEEVSRTPDPYCRSELIDYVLEIVEVHDDETLVAERSRQRMRADETFAALPDRADRELLGDALAFRCDVFCTRDHRTIVCRRDALPAIPIRILTPREWWAHLKPWAGLWA